MGSESGSGCEYSASMKGSFVCGWIGHKAEDSSWTHSQINAAKSKKFNRISNVEMGFDVGTRLCVRCLIFGKKANNLLYYMWLIPSLFKTYNIQDWIINLGDKTLPLLCHSLKWTKVHFHMNCLCQTLKLSSFPIFFFLFFFS